MTSTLWLARSERYPDSQNQDWNITRLRQPQESAARMPGKPRGSADCDSPAPTCVGGFRLIPRVRVASRRRACSIGSGRGIEPPRPRCLLKLAQPSSRAVGVTGFLFFLLLGGILGDVPFEHVSIRHARARMPPSSGRKRENRLPRRGPTKTVGQFAQRAPRTGTPSMPRPEIRSSTYSAAARRPARAEIRRNPPTRAPGSR